MRISIADITEEGLRLNFSGTEDILSEVLGGIPVPKGVRIDPRIRGGLLLVKQEAGTFLTGQVQATFYVECSRCLTEFQMDGHADFDLVIRPRFAGVPVSAMEQEPDETNACFAEGDELDVSMIIVQELLLDLPMKPLCKESCPGLCPTCGELQGSPSCSCRQEKPVDPRWAALANLKKKTDT
ncbi:MAG: DUF177 domain-containing protein [Pseudomonadota bacterium]